MQSLRFFIMLFLCVGSLLSGCRRTSSARLQLLERAEAIVEENPDSALTLLSALPDAATLSPSERALRGLVLTRALDKTYCDVDDDSIIAPAAEFFRGSSETRRHMMAAFCHGRVKANAADYPAALSLFTEAHELANSLDDIFWSARAAAELASIYGSTYHSAEELIYARQAFDGFKCSGNQPFINYSMLELSRAYNNVGNDSLAQSFARLVMDSAKTYSDVRLETAAENLLAHSYYLDGRYSAALPLLKRQIAVNPENRELRAMLGRSYLGIGRTDSAKIYLPTSSDISSTECMFLSDYYRKTGEYYKAMVLMDSALQKTDAVLSESLDVAFTRTLADYYIAQQQIRTLKLNYSRLLSVIIILVSVVVVVILTVIVVKILQRSKRERLLFQKESKRLIAESQRHKCESDRLYGVLINQRDLIENKQLKIDEKQAKLYTLIAEKYTVFNQLCQVYYENQTNKNLAKLLVKELILNIQNFSDENRMIEELGGLLDVHFDNVFSDLCRDLPKIKPEDKLVFIYSAVGITSGPATLFLKKQSVEFFYNHRTRLKAKILQLESDRKSDYIRLLRFNMLLK